MKGSYAIQSSLLTFRLTFSRLYIRALSRETSISLHSTSTPLEANPRLQDFPIQFNENYMG